MNITLTYLSRFFFSIPLLTISIFAHATDQIPIDRTITLIRAYENAAQIYVHFTPSFPSTEGCLAGGDYSVSIDTTLDSGKNAYSAVLSAAMANKKIGFGVSGCYGDRPRVYRVDVFF